MDEFEKLYTVEDIAKMTSLTSRTIRNYLKDGKLVGRKIGGQWRFTMKNIKDLFDSSNIGNDINCENKQQVIDFIEGVNTDITGDIQICTIADVYCDIKDAKSLCDKLCGIINDENNNFSFAKFNYDYVEKEQKARFTLLGNSEYIIKMLEVIK